METMPPLSLDEFRRQTGLSPIVIAGRHYVPRQAIADFNRRAADGEFAGKIANPSALRSKD